MIWYDDILISLCRKSDTIRVSALNVKYSHVLVHLHNIPVIKHTIDTHSQTVLLKQLGCVNVREAVKEKLLSEFDKKSAFPRSVPHMNQ